MYIEDCSWGQGLWSILATRVIFLFRCIISTSDAHRIRGNEGLIWVEFTKTAASVEKAQPSYVRRGKLHPMEPRKTRVTISSYFQRANEGKPIRSSIPEAVRDATTRAQQAEKSAAAAAQSANKSVIIGGIAAASSNCYTSNRSLYLFRSVVWRHPS